jgi:hypothetical protein
MANPIRIIILQRGWNLIGRFSEDEKGNFIIEEPCYVIRRWGTTGGLGQLAIEGPQGETKLDKTPTCRGHESALIYTIDVDEAKWKDHF